MIFDTYGSSNFPVDLQSISNGGDATEESVVKLTYLNGTTDDIFFGTRRQVSGSWQITEISQLEFPTIYQWLLETLGQEIVITQKAGEYLFGPAFAEEKLTIQLKEVKPVGEVAWTPERGLNNIEITAILLKNGDEEINIGSATSYNFLVEVSVNAISVDLGEYTLLSDLEAIAAAPEEGTTAVVRQWVPGELSRALVMFKDGAWERIPHLKENDVTFFDPFFSTEPKEISGIRNGDTRTREGTFDYQVFSTESAGQGEWVNTDYPFIGRYVPVVANVAELNLRGGLFYYASFSDTSVAGWQPINNTPASYKAGIIAKNGVGFPSFDTSIENGPCVEKLTGFSVRLDNSNRFHWKTMGFNFFGARVKLYILDNTSGTPQKVLIRSGINKTNSLDFSNYSFDVEPELYYRATETIPVTLVAGSDTIGLHDDENSNVKVPLTYGMHPNAKLIPTVANQSYLSVTTVEGRDEPIDTFNVGRIKDLADIEGLAVVRMALINDAQSGPGSFCLYQEEGMSKQTSFVRKLYHEGVDWFVKFNGYSELVPVLSEEPDDLRVEGSRPTDWDNSAEYPLAVMVDKLPATPEELLGVGCRIVQISVEFVIDDRVCQGFGPNENSPQVSIWLDDFEEFQPLPRGMFVPLEWRNGIKLRVDPAYCEMDDFNSLIVYSRYETGFVEGTAYTGKTANQKVDLARDLIASYIDKTKHIGSYLSSDTVLHVPVFYAGVVPTDPDDPIVYKEVYPVQSASEGSLDTLAAANAISQDQRMWWRRAKNANSVVNYQNDTGPRPFYPTLFWSRYLLSNCEKLVHNGIYTPWQYAQIVDTSTGKIDPTKLAKKVTGGCGSSITIMNAGAEVGTENPVGALYFPISSEIHNAMKGASEVRVLGGFMFQLFFRQEPAYNYGKVASTDDGYLQLSYNFPVTVTLTLVHKSDPALNVTFHKSLHDIAAAASAGDAAAWITPHIFNNLPGSLKGGNDRFYNFGNTVSGEGDVNTAMLWNDLTEDGIAIPFGVPNNDSVANRLYKNNSYDVVHLSNGFFQWAGVDLWDPIPDYLFDEGQGYEFANYRGLQITIMPRRDTMASNGSMAATPEAIATIGSDCINGAVDSIFFQRKTELSITDTDYFIEVKGRNDHLYYENTSAVNTPYQTPVSILKDAATQIGIRKVSGEIQSVDNYNTKLQISDDTTMEEVIDTCARHAWAVAAINETDGVVLKSIDYEDYGEGDIKFSFNESNVIKEESLEVKYRNYEEITRDFTFKYHFNEANGELMKELTVKFVDGQVVVEGLKIGDTNNYLYNLKASLKHALETDYQALFARSKTYYDSGKDNARTVEFKMASDFDARILDTTVYTSSEAAWRGQPVTTLVSLIRKALQFYLFNSWTVSFKTHMKYFVGTETNNGSQGRLQVGDYIELTTWFHADNNPIRGFVKALSPQPYDGLVEVTLFCPVPPDVYAVFYDPIWDGKIITESYSTDDYRIDPLNRYPFKGATAGAGEFPDGEVILPPYDASEATFSDGSYPDAEDPNEPF